MEKYVTLFAHNLQKNGCLRTIVQIPRSFSSEQLPIRNNRKIRSLESGCPLGYEYPENIVDLNLLKIRTNS